MPITNGKYVNPYWINDSSPAINANELNAISDTLEKLDKTNFVPQILVDSTVTGTTVTVTNGTTVLRQNYNGQTLVFDLDSFGTWTVTMTQGSQTSGAMSVVVNEVKQYPVTIAFFAASIIVSYPVGATASVSNGNIILTAPNTSGSYTFTVPLAGTWVVEVSDGNNTVTTNVLISSEGQVKNVIISSFETVASTTALSGVAYQTGILDNSSWDSTLLEKIAKAISDNSAITNRTTSVYIDSGADHYKLSVGDSAQWYISGQKNMFIMGFNHDKLASSTAYGQATATGMAGITFGMENCFADKEAIETSDSTSGGWGNSALRTMIQSTYYNSMFSGQKSIVKSVSKKYNLGGNNMNTISSINDTLFIPSMSEVTGNTFYAEGEQYAYYLAGNSTQKAVNSVISDWWVRTADSAQMYKYIGAISEETGGAPATDKLGVSAMLCV